MFILEGLKVLCFDTLLQVFILKVDSGIAGALGQFFAPSILLRPFFLVNAGGKGVRRLVGYFMGYYTIWVTLVKRFFVPFWELASEKSGVALPEFKTRSLKAEGCGTPARSAHKTISA